MLHDSPRLKNTCIRHVVLDKWFSPILWPLKNFWLKSALKTMDHEIARTVRPLPANVWLTWFPLRPVCLFATKLSGPEMGKQKWVTKSASSPSALRVARFRLPVAGPLASQPLRDEARRPLIGFPESTLPESSVSLVSLRLNMPVPCLFATKPADHSGRTRAPRGRPRRRGRRGPSGS